MAKVKTAEVATQVEALLEGGATLVTARAIVGLDKPENVSAWGRVCSVMYSKALAAAAKERDRYTRMPYAATTSEEELKRIIAVNEQLTQLALQIPETSTLRDIKYIEKLLRELPASEPVIVAYIGTYIMSPKMRAVQKHGRYSKLLPFQPFTKLLDAATLSYFRNNFISCFLTLAPIVEGVMLRWLGYAGGPDKPEFDDLRKFFRQGHLRQPRPHNAQFHKLHSDAAHVILNRHLFRPSQTGTGHGHFNRHQAAHLLSDVEFATQANCIRLFVLLDIMTQIYVFESRQPDPRFAPELATSPELTVYCAMLLERATYPLAEDIILGQG
ncbi:hypothetical protein [Hymenobacter defluvii]|uniref:Uncharacterized protein n=1 Tax=Hymenobacter defluvii TaxID=2054411 RepID=A0ABS3TFC3_9BACT|nr:hypothetical protein [Hymenobacter defluvii]MBO3272357.1 hypothetical protein [Hymenobacter defluvii]